MKRRKYKGRKIYKTKEKNYYDKSFSGKLLSLFLTLILLGGVGFIGYSVAEPLLNFSKKAGDTVSESVPEPVTETVTALTSETAQTATTYQTTTVSAVRTTTASKVSATTSSYSDTDSETVTTSVQKKNSDDYRASSIPLSAVRSIDALDSALFAIPAVEDIEYIEVPLKVSGGVICYNCTSQEARSSNAIVSTLEIRDIVTTIKNHGYKPSASVSTFDDAVLPLRFPSCGYTFRDDSLWLDKNGQPHSSPFSDAALAYNSYVIQEAAAAGFEKIICTDFRIPEFSQEELKNLDSKFGDDSERCTALVSAFSFFKERASDFKAEIYPQFNAEDILLGRDEMFFSKKLNTDKIAVNIDIDNISGTISDRTGIYEFSGTPADMTEKMLGLIKGEIKGKKVTVRITGTDCDWYSLYEAGQKAAEIGFGSFIVG